ncbi:ELMO/CED-12 family-domain-containing protein [Mycotypha africana]|uniref:ELMO/CED-12 family-domain-containing protein n=1 Tax=Mycotypha africana TaxID=64632 RepID=UPI0023007549|nr:ELMO/CED-12 family-domain-containing protein [Mycotypha africana]KAI8970180.1 ELMO/CED-12 family-domain-containing protein [Mycotypha africana]
MTTLVEKHESKKKQLQLSPISKHIVQRIHRSIYHSRELINEKNLLYENKVYSLDIEAIAETIMYKKQFPLHVRFDINSAPAQILRQALSRIHGYQLILAQVEEEIAEKYKSENKEHEKKLLDLWNEMKPNTPLNSRISKQWVDIGFQGSDPATDFRGMGVHGLNDLLYFVQHYPTIAHSVLQHASHPVYWYPYAIVGINITKFAYQLLETKKLQLHLFEYGTSLAQFTDFYCYLFYTFNRFWVNHEPKLTVMDFERKFNDFKLQIEKDLSCGKINMNIILQRKKNENDGARF